MNKEVAEKIADLLNSSNVLASQYTYRGILNYSNDYIVIQNDDDVIGCVCVRSVSWYQFELKHLVVAEAYRRMGYGRKLIEDAVRLVKERGGMVVQCTIREGNNDTRKLFRECGFGQCIEFTNKETGNVLKVYQKAVDENNNSRN